MTPDAGPGSRLELAKWLLSPAAEPALAAARVAVERTPRDPLAAGARLRQQEPDLAPDRAAAVLEQVSLRRLARARYGIDEDRWLTRDGLEQATRPEVAARRAGLLVADRVGRVLDITGGLGFDTAACLTAGLAVTVVERDPVTAAFLTRNCPGARVVTDDITRPGLLDALLEELSATDVVFADPARRDPTGARDAGTARARTERDPARWSPPWPFVEAIAHPRVLAKVAPGFPPPPHWAAEWVSVDRTVVECSVRSWGHGRRAVVITHDGSTIVDADERTCSLAGNVGAWLHEPDPAVSRAGAVGALRALDPDLAALDPSSTWLTSDRPSPSPAYRSFLVVGELTGSPRRQRRMLADAGVHTATVKSRDVDAEPREVLRSLGIAEGGEHAIVLTRRGGRVVSYAVRPAGGRSG